MTEQSDKDAISDEQRQAIDDWFDRLADLVYPGIDYAEIERHMINYAQDQAWLYYGGSGNRSRFYLLSNDIQARFDFDSNDLLQSYAVYRKEQDWQKGPGDILLQGAESTDIEVELL